MCVTAKIIFEAPLQAFKKVNLGSLVKSLRKSNEELKKLLASARSDIKSLEERVGAQELVVREGANGGREAQLETERSLEWLHDSESSFQSELHGIRKRLDDISVSWRLR